ncbi:hypothetical protein Tco_0908625 [Tanacetum coccineum]|uniref:Uncharacterized protein n=1 Tax=Tanacetum coccineum TaxID=301880 RepID=A0ABQ5CMQ2_9ASTR
MMIDPTMTHKEEIYQVILEIIKNTTFYKAILAYADVPKIYMYQFWFTVTKIKNTDFYEFKLANKKCLVYVEVLRQALDICPRVPEKEFIVPPSEEELLTFLIRLEYKGELTHLPQMFIDHMHQPWRTIASIINKFLSRKTTSNDRLCQSRVAIIWEDVQEYGRAIPDAMSTDAIKQSETYKAFINYSTGLVPPKKTKVFDESDHEPARRQTSKRRISKKKVSIFADDNIIPEPDVALELGKSMSLTKAPQEEAARQVHVAFERIENYTLSLSKKISPDPSQKLKGTQTLTTEEQLVADTMQALKASRSQPHVEGSSEGTDVSPGVLDESTVIFTTLSKGTGTKPGVPYEGQGCLELKLMSYLNRDSKEEEKKDDADDDRSVTPRQGGNARRKQERISAQHMVSI